MYGFVSQPVSHSTNVAATSSSASTFTPRVPLATQSTIRTENKTEIKASYLDLLEKKAPASTYGAPSYSTQKIAYNAPSFSIAEPVSVKAPAVSSVDYIAALSGNKATPKWVDDNNWTPKKSGGDYLSNLKKSSSTSSFSSYAAPAPVAAAPAPGSSFEEYMRKRGGSTAPTVPSYSVPSKSVAPTSAASSGDYMAALSGNKPAPKWVDDNNWTVPKNSGGDYLSNLKKGSASFYSTSSYSSPAPAVTAAPASGSFEDYMKKRGGSAAPSYSAPSKSAAPVSAASSGDYMAALSGNKPAPKWVDDNNWTVPKNSGGDYLSNLKKGSASFYSTSSYSSPAPAASAAPAAGSFEDYMKKRGGSAAPSYSAPSKSAAPVSAASSGDYMAALSGNKPAPKWVDDNNWTVPKNSGGDYLSNLKKGSASSYSTSSYSSPAPAASAAPAAGSFEDYMRKRGGSAAPATPPYSAPSKSPAPASAASSGDYIAALSGNKPAPKWVDDNNWTIPKNTGGDYLSNLKKGSASSYSTSYSSPAPAVSAAPAAGSFEDYMRKRGGSAAPTAPSNSAASYSPSSKFSVAAPASTGDYMMALSGNRPAPKWVEY